MSKKILFLVMFTLLIPSCKQNKSFKTICPTGAPSILYYTEGNNSNFVTESSTPKIVAQFQRDEYDAIVIDATSGLNAIKKYPTSPYKFAKLLTAGNLFLVSAKNDKVNHPQIGDSVLAFPSTKDGIPHLSLNYFLNSVGKTDYENTVQWVDGVQGVASRLNNNDQEFDYYLLADPVYTTLKNKHTFTYSKRLNEEMKISIPQAALFINEKTYNAHPNDMKSYIEEIRTRAQNIINTPAYVREELNRFGDEQAVTVRFGFSSAIVEPVQEHNGFAINENFDQPYGAGEINKFLELVGSDVRYDDSLFINL